MNKIKIVLLVNDSYFSSILSRNLFLLKNAQISGVFISKKIKGSINNIWSVFKKTHHKYFIYRVFLYLFFEKMLNLICGKLFFSVEKMAQYFSIPILSSKNINSPEDLINLRNMSPDVVVSINFDQILKKPILELPKHGCINYHASLLPDYKGFSPYFWILVNKEPYGGISIYKMADGIDVGEIFAQKKISTSRVKSLFRFNLDCVDEGAKLLFQVLERIAEGKIEIKGYSDNATGRYFSFPSRSGVAKLYRNNIKLIRVRDILQSIIKTKKFFDATWI